MSQETYTPGHSLNATDFMSKRTLESHGQFFMPHLKPGLSLLDGGCGPGTITLGLARAVKPGSVIGIDFGASQIEAAQKNAAAQGAANADFQAHSCYQLPFRENTFDRVFSHALLEHLAEPGKALQEFHRVLKPGGILGVCSPDWGGFLMAPPSEDLQAAVEAYVALQRSNGGDPNIGRQLGGRLRGAGFAAIQMGARYECYPSLNFIGEYLALQLEAQSQRQHAAALRQWSAAQDALFAQAWVWAIGTK